MSLTPISTKLKEKFTFFKFPVKFSNISNDKAGIEFLENGSINDFYITQSFASIVELTNGMRHFFSQ